MDGELAKTVDVESETHGEMGIDICKGGDESERGFTADGHTRAREREMRKIEML